MAFLRRPLSTALFSAAALLLMLLLSLAFADPNVARAEGGETANVWVAHYAPFADTDEGTSVTVTVSSEGSTIAELTDVRFNDTTGGYVTLPAGVQLDIDITPTGATDPAISESLTLTADMDYTVAAIGGANGWALELLPLVDDNSPPAAANGKVRVGHLAPFAPTSEETEVDIRTDGGVLVLDDVPYGVVSGYLELPTGEYDLQITTPDGESTIFDIPPFTLNSGAIVSAFAIGDGQNQAVDVTLLVYEPGVPTAVTLDTLNATGSTGGMLSWLLGAGALALAAGALVLRRRRV